MLRKLVSSGSYLEPEIGFSRAVRVGQLIAVAGTAPIAAAGGTAAPGDLYGQTIRCLEIISRAISERQNERVAAPPLFPHPPSAPEAPHLLAPTATSTR